MRINQSLTSITALSPVNLATGTTAAPDASSQPIYVTRWSIQATHSATNGLVYVMDGVKPIGRVPAISTDAPMELAAATATAPGGSAGDTDANQGGGIDLRTVWIDVATSNTPVRVSYDYKI